MTELQAELLLGIACARSQGFWVTAAALEELLAALTHSVGINEQSATNAETNPDPARSLSN